MPGPTPAITGTITDPDFRRRRASHAAKARTSLDYYVQQVVDRAPALTDEQVDRLRGLLPPAGEPQPQDAA
jgi:hypothetical protein